MASGPLIVQERIRICHEHFTRIGQEQEEKRSTLWSILLHSSECRRSRVNSCLCMERMATLAREEEWEEWDCR